MTVVTVRCQVFMTVVTVRLSGIYDSSYSTVVMTVVTVRLSGIYDSKPTAWGQGIDIAIPAWKLWINAHDWSTQQHAWLLHTTPLEMKVGYLHSYLHSTFITKKWMLYRKQDLLSLQFYRLSKTQGVNTQPLPQLLNVHALASNADNELVTPFYERSVTLLELYSYMPALHVNSWCRYWQLELEEACIYIYFL